MPLLDPTSYTHNFSGQSRRRSVSLPPIFKFSETTKIFNMNTEEVADGEKLKGKKLSNELSDIIKERKKEMKEKELKEKGVLLRGRERELWGSADWRERDKDLNQDFVKLSPIRNGREEKVDHILEENLPNEEVDPNKNASRNDEVLRQEAVHIVCVTPITEVDKFDEISTFAAYLEAKEDPMANDKAKEEPELPKDFGQEEAHIVPKDTEEDDVVEVTTVAVVHATDTAANEDPADIFDTSEDVTEATASHVDGIQGTKIPPGFPFDPGIDDKCDNKEMYVFVQNPFKKKADGGLLKVILCQES